MLQCTYTLQQNHNTLLHTRILLFTAEILYRKTSPFSHKKQQHTHIKEDEKELVLREAQMILWLLEDTMT